MNQISLRAQAGALSHTGRVRQSNEDSFFADDESGLWAVADGMGGHERGEWASAALIDEIGRPFGAAGFEGRRDEVAERIHRANRAIYEEAQARNIQMGSTIVALFVEGARFAILWAGDSRAYLLRGGILHRLSKDHSQVQEMVDRGLLSPEQAEGHPMGHVIARAVGVAGTLAVDVVEDEVEPGDTFLLCSDGLHGSVGDEEIADLLGRHPPEAAAAGLVDATLGRGAPDNVTVIAVRFAEPTLLSLRPGETIA
jgi:serine/threonine protein phosphatase PrpC